MSATVAERNFTGQQLPHTLSELKNDRATGTLQVATLTATRELLFVDGEIRAARSTAETEKLGSWLVSKGVISEVFKQSALLSQDGGDSPPFGHILVSQGATNKETLERHLEHLALTILERAAAETHQKTVFLDGEGSNQLDTLPQIATPQLILIAARAVPDLNEKRKTLGPIDQLVARSNSLDEIVQEFNLHVPEAVILGKLHHGRTIEELHRVSSLDDNEFYSSVYALKAAGIVDFFAKPTRAATVTITTTTAPSPQESAEQAPETSPERRPQKTVANPTAEQDEINRLAEMTGKANHYEFFGINREASYQQVFDVWEAFQEKFSPERANEPHLKDLAHKLNKIFEHAQDAFEVLSSPVKRPRYERMIRPATEQEAELNVSSGSYGGDPAEARATLVAHNLKQVDRLVRMGDVFSAVTLLEQTCHLDPKPSSLVKLAKLMLLNPNWTNRALDKMRRAVEIDPSFVEGWLAVADFWHDRGSAERERKSLERALVADPDHPTVCDRYRELRGPKDLRALQDRVRKVSDG